MNNITSLRLRLLAHFMVLVVLFGAVPNALAFEIYETGVIAADEVINDDVLIGAETVTVDGTVNGNLIVSGATVTINGTVNGDVIVNSQSTTINGTVNGNLFAAGASYTLNGSVTGTVFFAGYSLNVGNDAEIGRNLVFAGFSLELEEGSTLQRDGVLAGYQIISNGDVLGGLTVESAALEVRGKVAGDIEAAVSEPEEIDDRDSLPPFFVEFDAVEMVNPGLRIEPSAQLGGKLVYKSPVEQAENIKTVPEGGVEYIHQADKDAAPVRTRVQFVVEALVNRLQFLISMLILGLLAVWRMPALMTQLAEQAKSKPLPAAGTGLVTLAGGYAAAGLIALALLVISLMLALVTLGDLARTFAGIGFAGLAFVMALFTAIVFYGSKLVIAFLVGRLIIARLLPQSAAGNYTIMAVGVAVFVLVESIPVFGWLVGAGAIAVGLGAIWFVFRQWQSPNPPAVADQASP